VRRSAEYVTTERERCDTKRGRVKHREGKRCMTKWKNNWCKSR